MSRVVNVITFMADVYKRSEEQEHVAVKHHDEKSPDREALLKTPQRCAIPMYQALHDGWKPIRILKWYL